MVLIATCNNATIHAPKRASATLNGLMICSTCLELVTSFGNGSTSKMILMMITIVRLNHGAKHSTVLKTTVSQLTALRTTAGTNVLWKTPASLTLSGADLTKTRT